MNFDKMSCTTSMCWRLLLMASLCGHSIASKQTADNDDSFDEEGETQIINGEAIPEGRFPFMAAVVVNMKNFCGASIISPTYLLTAAHCVKDPEDNPFQAKQLRVGVGSTKQNRMSWHKVAEVRSHRDYKFDKISLGNDIAFIKLARPLRMKKGRVEAITFPRQNAPVPGKLGLIGWGITHNGATDVVDHLRGVVIHVIDVKKCARLTGLRYTNKVFCDDGKSRSSCSGDSGSPLFNFVNGKFVQHGLVSGGIDEHCGELPGFYTKVAPFSRLIDKLIKD